MPRVINWSRPIYIRVYSGRGYILACYTGNHWLIVRAYLIQGLVVLMITSTGYASFPNHACTRCRAFIVFISGSAALSHVETNWNGNLLQEGLYAIHRQVRQDTLCPSVSLHVSSAFSLFSYSFFLYVLVSFHTL